MNLETTMDSNSQPKEQSHLGSYLDKRASIIEKVTFPYFISMNFF